MPLALIRKKYDPNKREKTMSEIEVFGKAEITTQQSDTEKEIASKASGGDILASIRLVQPTASTEESPAGSWELWGTGNIGKDVRVLIGPWRFHAIRFKDSTVDAEDFNLTPNSRYVAIKNDWETPDGLTPGYQEILDKKVPDSPSPLVSNCAGYDFLFWLPDHHVFATYLLARTALTMTDVLVTGKQNKGGLAQLSGVKAPSKKHNWMIPSLSLIEGDFSPPDPEQTKKIFDQFVSPGKVYDPSTGEATTRPR